jgi:hypothetical protein
MAGRVFTTKPEKIMAKTLKITNGDIVRSATNAQYTYVEDKEKVRQDVREVLTTSINPLTGLGSDLDSIVGSTSFNPADTYSYLPPMFNFQGNVESALNRLIRVQKSYLLSQRTYHELISGVSPVQIWPIVGDPRNFRWKVQIKTYFNTYGFNVGGTTRI